MHIRTLTLTVALVAAVGLAACTADEPTVPETTPAGTPEAVAEPDEPTTPEPAEHEAAALDLASPSVELIDAGAEPREHLRFAPTEGDVATTEMVMVTSVEVEVDGETQPGAASPPIRMVIGSAVTAVTADGDISVEFAFEGTEVIDDGTTDPQVREQIAAAISQIEGLAGTLTVTDRGEFVDGTIETGQIADPTIAELLDQSTQQMDAMTVPFPEEVVGVGAVWEVTTAMTFEGIDTTQTMVYELVERDGDRYLLDIELTQRAEAQELRFPGMPPGSAVELVDHVLTGQGSLAGDLTALFPLESEMRGDGTIDLVITEDGEETRLVQHLTTEVAMRLLD